MVVIRRKLGQELWIGGVHIVIIELTKSTVAVGIDVPPEVPIYRDSPTGKITSPADAQLAARVDDLLGVTP